MHPTTFEAFTDELEKIAVSEDWVRRHSARGAIQRNTREGGHATLTNGKARPQANVRGRSAHARLKNMSPERAAKAQAMRTARNEAMRQGHAESHPKKMDPASRKYLDGVGKQHEVRVGPKPAGATPPPGAAPQAEAPKSSAGPAAGAPKAEAKPKPGPTNKAKVKGTGGPVPKPQAKAPSGASRFMTKMRGMSTGKKALIGGAVAAPLALGAYALHRHNRDS